MNDFDDDDDFNGMDIFITEGQELLEQMEQALLVLDQQSEDAESVNQIFRAIHTIKGSAGLVGLDDIIEFTHKAEHVLSDVRKGSIPVTSNLISVMIEVKDHLQIMFQDVLNNQKSDKVKAGGILVKLEVFQQVTENKKEKSKSDVSQQDSESGKKRKKYLVQFYLGRDTLREGFIPSQLLGQISGLGFVEETQLLTDRLPAFANLEPDACYLGWRMILTTSFEEKSIHDIFEFVDGVNLQVILLNKVSEPDAVLPVSAVSVAEGAQPVRSEEEELELLFDAEVDSRNQIENPSLSSLENESNIASQKLSESGEVSVHEETESNNEIKKSGKVVVNNQIRVNSQKLDRLINLIGELVTMNTQLTTLVDLTKSERAIESLGGIKTTLEDIRETALGLRMVEIGSTFDRFKRVVRDTSLDLGKKIKLDIRGGDTELDKAVVERIFDPLTHMVRNSIDHGIESPADRAKAGKPEEGSIYLNAYHESGAIVIEIRDDGKGLNKEKLLARARELGIVKPNQILEDSEIYGLIFEAGFTTAKVVTNISGRGVGMDVVRRNIEALRGQIELESELGKGTRFIIRIPLTLAIIDGFLVRIAGDDFVIPLASITECLSLKASEIVEKSDGYNMINLRSELLPLLKLDEYLGIHRQPTEKKNINIVVVQFGNKKVGLVVDELLGESQAVIKPLGKVFYGMKWITGFTIMGAGNVALIFDVAGLIKEATSRESDRKPSNQSPHTKPKVGML